MHKLSIGEPEYRSLARIALKVDFFQPLKGEQLEEMLSHIRLYGYDSGEAIFQKGEPAEAFYLIHEGKVSIRLKNRFLGLIRRVVKLGAGNFFGEMALLWNRPRSSTAFAEGPVKLFVLLQQDFKALLEKNPALSKHLEWIATQRRFESSHG